MKYNDHQVILYNRCPRRFQYEYHSPSSFMIMEIPALLDDLIDAYLGITTRHEDGPITFDDLTNDQWYAHQQIEGQRLIVEFPRIQRVADTINAYVCVHSFYPRLDVQAQLQCMYALISKTHYRLGMIQIIFLNEDYIYNGKSYKPAFMFKTSDYMCDRGGNAFTPILSILNDQWIVSRLKGMDALIDRPLADPIKCSRGHFCPYKSQCFPVHAGQVNDKATPQWTIDQDRLQAWLDHIQYPLYFIDFEWTQLLLPWQKGQHFINDFVFEYALIKMEKDGSTTSKIYITKGSNNKALFTSLIDRLEDHGTIFAYNAKGAEIMQLRRFASWYPSYHEKVCKIIDRILSIDVPLLSHMIYDKASKGAYGLKQVANQIGFDGYTTVEVLDGLQAVDTYRHYCIHHDQTSKTALQQYCYMDVRSMIALLQWYQYHAYQK